MDIPVIDRATRITVVAGATVCIASSVVAAIIGSMSLLSWFVLGEGLVMIAIALVVPGADNPESIEAARDIRRLTAAPPADRA